MFEADLRTGELRKNGLRVKIQEKPFQIWGLLAKHAGEAVTREELREKLWSSDTFADFDHSLGTAMGKLRQALGDSAKKPISIETLGGRGYRFIAPVASHLPPKRQKGPLRNSHCRNGKYGSSVLRQLG